jgi:hypothetical protein
MDKPGRRGCHDQSAGNVVGSTAALFHSHPELSMRHILVLALVLAGCSASGETPMVADASLSPGSQTMTNIDVDLGSWPADPLTFMAVRVEGDLLIAQVQHAGGCTEHGFALVFSPVFMESYPVQAMGILSHDARGDNCRALIGRTLSFDLSPLKQTYRDAYRVDSDTIILRGNWPGTVRYAF